MTLLKMIIVLGLLVAAILGGLYMGHLRSQKEELEASFQVTEEIRNELRLELEQSNLSDEDKAIAFSAIDSCMSFGEERKDDVTRRWWEVTSDKGVLASPYRGSQATATGFSIVVGTWDYDTKQVTLAYVIYYASPATGEFRITSTHVYERTKGVWRPCEKPDEVAKVKEAILDSFS